MRIVLDIGGGGGAIRIVCRHGVLAPSMIPEQGKFVEIQDLEEMQGIAMLFGGKFAVG